MARELAGDAAEAVGQALQNARFPAEKRALIEEAQRRGVAEDVIAILERFPQHTYSSMADLRRAAGKAVESLHHRQGTSSRKIGHVLDEEE